MHALHSFFLSTGWHEFIAKSFLCIAAFATMLLVFHTVRAFVSRAGIFVPEPDSSGMQFIQLTHYAFRPALAKMDVAVRRMQSHPETAPQFVKMFMEYAW